MEGSAVNQLVDKFFGFAAVGDVEKMNGYLSAIPDVNVRNAKGWTALMFAARNGHKDVVKLLIDNGCETDIINSSGQTAADIAVFWNHAEVAEILKNASPLAKKRHPDIFPEIVGPQKSMYLCSASLDRASDKRKDKDWLEARMNDSRSRFIIFVKLQPLVVPALDVGGARFSLLGLSSEKIREILRAQPLVVFLGVERKSTNQNADAVAWFAIGLEELTNEEQRSLDVESQLLPLYPGILQLSRKDAGMFSQARSVLAWHDRYQFCPTCGSQTFVEDAGYKRTCVDKNCKSREGVHNTCYPRVDPSVIMAVVSPDRKRLLLGRSKQFPPNMYSCLSGYMEPGESFEDAVRREVMEESGVNINHVEYIACQPWPVPSSLMFGCFAYATNTEIKIDPDELSDARWFGRKEVVQMLTRSHPSQFFCPPQPTIAHSLISTWTARIANL